VSEPTESQPTPPAEPVPEAAPGEPLEPAADVSWLKYERVDRMMVLDYEFLDDEPD
jgi:hypothetical protein